MTNFDNRFATIDEYINDNALNARLFAWIKTIDPKRQTGGSVYAFTTKRREWEGRAYDVLNFVCAYDILRYMENGSLPTIEGERNFRFQNHIFQATNPFYFTWAIIYAYLRTDDRFKVNPSILKFQLDTKLKEVHSEAYDSLSQLISEEISRTAETEIAINTRDMIIELTDKVVQSQEQEINELETRNMELEAELKDLKKKIKMSEKEMMGFYFSKIASEFLEKSKKKKQETREKAKESLQSIMNALKLHKHVPEDLQEAIDNFDNIEPQPIVVNELVQAKYVENEIQNVESGGTGVTKNYNKK